LALPQCRAGDSCIKGGVNQRYQLTGPPEQRSEHGGDVCGAIRTLPDQRSRRKRLVGRINNGPASHKRNAMDSCDSCCDMRFHVDRGRPCLGMEQLFFHGIGEGDIYPNDVRVHSSRKPLE
jgi:hypothetical protein